MTLPTRYRLEFEFLEHQACETISTYFRPVPLHWYYSYTAPPPKGVQLVDLMTKDKEALNPKLATKAALLEEARKSSAVRAQALFVFCCLRCLVWVRASIRDIQNASAAVFGPSSVRGLCLCNLDIPPVSPYVATFQVQA
eukprot:scaffold52407_cov21-Tisochrysis_lutea.AAC.2